MNSSQQQNPIYIQQQQQSISYFKKQSSNSILSRTFKSLDYNNLGRINKKIILSGVMYTSDYYDRQYIQKQLSICPDQITYQQFQSIFKRSIIQTDQSSSEWIFKLYDQDNKGFIDKYDLQRATKITGVQLTQEQIESMLKAENQMVNGKMYLQDFKEIMKRQIYFD